MIGEILRTRSGIEEAVLIPSSEKDAVFQMYTSQSTTFASVTPLILPGIDDFKYEKTEKLVLKSFKQAGFDTSNLVNLKLSKEPILPGAFHPLDYRHPRLLFKIFTQRLFAE